MNNRKENEREDNNIFMLSKTLEDSEKNKNSDENKKPADFETAIAATGFGKFNIILLLIAIPSGWSSIFETTTMSYVFPAAQCDLSLTLENKGFLNAITYIGMISSAFVWGFLCDTLGRKKLLSFGLFLDGIFVLMSASSQNATLLMISKFLGGFIINGPFAALTTYLSEFHCARHRARIQMTLGIVFSLGTVILPLLAWAILPLNLSFKINETVEFHSWNLYLCLCAFPALISSIAFIFMPESPKFLMTTGRNEKALQVFRRVYCFNTGNAPEMFPIKELVEETKLNNDAKHGGRVTANRTKIQAMKEGFQQFTPLFFPPHLSKIILVCLLQMMTMMSLNTLRLWLPQIFQAINDYQYFNNGSTTDLCTMIDQIRPSNKSSEECEVNLNNSFVYINSIIVAMVSIGGYIVAGMLINALGKKRLLNILGIVSGLSAMCLYFAQNTVMTIVSSCIFVSLGSISINVVLAVVVDLFPTTLRTMTISLTMMIGRSGAMLGNLVFPVLLQLGCAPPFFAVGAAIIACALLSCLLPNTDLKALQ